MNIKDALLATQDADRMPAEVDRRLRRRLGLEGARASRPVWMWPALGGLAVAAVIALVVFAGDDEPRATVATAPAAEIERPSTETKLDASITASPGTRVTTKGSSVVLTSGEIQIRRTETKPLFVEVPMGRVVISSYQARVTADRESMTILLDDGTGTYTDTTGQIHEILAGTPLIWPKAESPAPPAPAVPKRVTKPSVTSPAEEVRAQEVVEEPPPVPRATDVACTFKSDCGSGQTCRKNEDGASVCMGNGGAGAACWFDNDCLSQSCVQRRCN